MQKKAPQNKNPTLNHYAVHLNLMKISLCAVLCSVMSDSLQPHGAVLKNMLANAGDARDVVSIPGTGRSPGGGNGNHSSILAWKIPWTEEPSELQPVGCKELDTTE